MAITVTPVGTNQYEVAVSPPDGPPWRSDEPLTATEVLETLSSLGCHSTEITDALYASGSDWTVFHDAEVRRRREQ
jgi:hypothetical protein